MRRRIMVAESIFWEREREAQKVLDRHGYGEFDPANPPGEGSSRAVRDAWKRIRSIRMGLATLIRGQADRAQKSHAGTKGGKSLMCKRHAGQSITVCGCLSPQEEMHKRNAALMRSCPKAEARAERIAAALGLKPNYVKNQISSRKQRARYSRFYPKLIR